jgi:hypothetical protein
MSASRSARHASKQGAPAADRTPLVLPPTGAEIWFSEEIALDPIPTSGVMSLREFVRRTGRGLSAVTMARRQGHLARPRPDASPVGISSRAALIVATEADISRWRLHSMREALRLQPDLPQRVSDWTTIAGLAGRLGISTWRARRFVDRAGVPVLEWGTADPFRGKVRVYWPAAVRTHGRWDEQSKRRKSLPNNGVRG